MSHYTADELKAMGFSQVGPNVRVSRKAVFYCISGSMGDHVRIDDFAILTGNLQIGSNVHISPFCFLSGAGGCIKLGDGVGFSTHVSVFTKSDDYQQVTDGPRAKVTGDIVVGDYSIFGAQCVLLPGVVVGKNCSIGVGCVVHDDIPDAARYVSVGIKSVRLS